MLILLIKYENQKDIAVKCVIKQIFIESQILDIKDEKEI